MAKIRASASNGEMEQPDPDPKKRLHQLRVIKAAYENLTHEAPLLPSSDSALPALLAIRSTQRLITETKESSRSTFEQLASARQQLSEEEADLKDAKLLRIALEERAGKLRSEYEDKSQKSPEEAAREVVREQQLRQTSYEGEIKRLVKAFNKFIDEHLAGMLAAEDLGGPIVGDLLVIDDEVLEAGFNRQGKVKRTKILPTNQEAERQRRFDEIWDRPDLVADGDDSERTEREAAGSEMRSLAEELLNAANEESHTNAYVNLVRDSAAARFLIRSKVAQFHPEDARKLRLIDFARRWDD